MGNINDNKDLATYLFHQGNNCYTYDFLGAHFEDGCWFFRVWAPGAKRVFVTGDFCNWENFVHMAQKIEPDGIFQCEIKDAQEYDCYKFGIETKDGRVILKSDPYGFHFETRPGTSSKLINNEGYVWSDEKWMKERNQKANKPMSIYEVNFGTWRTYENGEFFSYKKMADELIEYAKEMGFTHIELMPMSEYPYDKSWGYQVTGYFAPTSRYGVPKDFMYFVDKAHEAGLGIILDWVPAHFPKDASGLYEFDGTCLYEYEDSFKQEHELWGTRVFDFGKKEVISFLISNACYWLKEFHIDGLRVDAVASMLYLDYGRDNWLPNIYGGNGNLEAVEFLKQLNTVVHREFEGVITIAEESTSWPKITVDIQYDGLGFDYKWNMGWMNDSLRYMSIDPYFRAGEHSTMSFSLSYAFAEKYILPLSHDEVVHGKYSLIGKMPGDYEEKFANLRAYLSFMYAHPGKKLLFMGAEFGQFVEWRDEEQLEWSLLGYEAHSKHQYFVKSLNNFYKKNIALWKNDDDHRSFEWGYVDDYQNNIFSFYRKTIDDESNILCINNFSGQLLECYKLGVNFQGSYTQIFSTDDECFGGSNINNKTVTAVEEDIHNRSCYIEITLPPLSTLFFEVNIQSKFIKNKK